jgi:hypothetical protein
MNVSESSTRNPQPVRDCLPRGETVSLAADVYAMGVTMCEMLSREAPFGGMDVSDIRAKVTSGARPNIPVTCPRNLQVSIIATPFPASAKDAISLVRDQPFFARTHPAGHVCPRMAVTLADIFASQILIKDMWSHTLSARPSMAECLSQFRAMLGACIAAGGGGGGF